MAIDLSFCYLNQTDKDRIVELRKEAFHSNFKNRVDLSGLNWNNTDENSIHIGIVHNSDLISSLRLSFFKDRKRFEDTTLMPTPEELLPPFSLLSRAATKTDYAKMGLHSQLRCRAYEICLHLKMNSIYGNLEVNAIRFENLINMGYRVLARQHGWPNSYLKSNGDIALVYIDSPNSIQTYVNKILNQYNLNKLNDYPDKVILI